MVLIFWIVLLMSPAFVHHTYCKISWWTNACVLLTPPISLLMMLGVAQHWFMARAEHSPNLMGPSCHHSAGHSMGYAPLDVIPVQGLGLSRSLSESSTYKYFIAIRPQTDLSPVACLWHFSTTSIGKVFPCSDTWTEIRGQAFLFLGFPGPRHGRVTPGIGPSVIIKTTQLHGY